MHHIAIMKKSWHLTEKIISGSKTIESRWYKHKRDPWDKITSGDTIYFKNSGEPVTIRAMAAKVLQFSDLTSEKIRTILEKYQKELDIDNVDKFHVLVKNKKYCILIFLEKPEKTKPFDIDKRGFGLMSAWLCVNDVNKIKKPY